jgi:glycosyltransferase involved in cell wall biosynthesis
LLVFADDWGRHPSSCQHLVRRWLDRHSVLWVNTIGTRRPRLDFATLRRGLEKLRHWTRKTDSQQILPRNLRVCNPTMWPWFRTSFDRRLNRTVLARQLTNKIRDLPVAPLAVTTLPIVADLVGLLPVKRWIYYCVDDFSEWPGLDSEPLRRMEEILIKRADKVLAVSEALQSKIEKMGRSAELLTHGVDINFWTHVGPRPENLKLVELQRPLIVFWGVIDRRMDVVFVNRLAEDLEYGTIVLAGPEEDPDPALFASNRIVRLGKIPYEELPNLAREAAILVMPYADLPVTRAMQPLKLKEYLVTGKPTVVRDLPSTRLWSNCLDLANSPETFVNAIRLRLNTGMPKDQAHARAARLQSESWDAKAHAFERWALAD